MRSNEYYKPTPTVRKTKEGVFSISLILFVWYAITHVNYATQQSQKVVSQIFKIVESTFESFSKQFRISI